MQLSRIKRMSKKRRAEWIKAIDELVQGYKKNTHYTRACPFCKIVNFDCKTCIWNFFEGIRCDKYAMELDLEDVPDVMDSGYKKWKVQRLRMLKEWKKVLKEK